MNYPSISIFANDTRTWILLLTIAGGGMINVPVADAEDIQAQGCYLQLKNEAQIPARERGLLKRVLVSAGDDVARDQVLASLEDREALVSVKLAEIDLKVAQRRDKDGVTADVAAASLDEARKLTQQARLAEEVSRKTAESEIAVRQAQEAGLLAKDALDRAEESREKFRSSVSSRELATLKHDLNRANLDVEQARFDRVLMVLQAGSAAVLIEQREATELRLQLELQDAQLEQSINGLTAQRMQAALDLAQAQLDRQHMKSPIDGVVVEELRHAGEWVEAGDPIMRVVQLDTLYADGFVAADLVDQSWQGYAVTVTGKARNGIVTLNGKVVFVSPEVDSVNRQVAVRALINNADRLLRPGQPIEMTIHAK